MEGNHYDGVDTNDRIQHNASSETCIKMTLRRSADGIV